MRPFFVEELAPTVEATLLNIEVSLRRRSGVLLESQVHPLVTTVLLRLAWVDALVKDAEMNPPNRQRRKSAGSR